MSELGLPAGVEAAVFDVGGVFVVPDPDVLRAHLAPITLPDDDDAFVTAHYHGIAGYDGSDDAPERWPAYMEDYLAALGVGGVDLPSALAGMRAAWELPSPGMWRHRVADHGDQLKRLADSGFPVAIVSNADGNIETVLREGRIAQEGDGPGARVTRIVDSAVVGFTKPDPRIFPFATDALGVDPARCLYLGDSYRNDVEGARAAGLIPVHLDPLGLRSDGDHLRVRSVGALVDALLA